MQLFDQRRTSSQAGDGQYEIDYLMKQYPWFSKEEIREAVERFAGRTDRVIPYLDMKSGTWPVVDGEDF